MLSRNSVARTAQKAVRSQRQPANRRGLAAPASGSFQYETGDAKGVKFASRDLPGPTTHLAIVSKAGTRYETLPGLTLGLRSYAFKVRAWRPRTPTSFSRPFIHPRRLLPPAQRLRIPLLTPLSQSTQKRSALRIQRESELLGSELFTNSSRENLVVGAKFLRDDLPYFVELLAEVASQTKYARTLPLTRTPVPSSRLDTHQRH